MPEGLATVSAGLEARFATQTVTTRILIGVVAALSVGVIAVRFAEPILDGDLFWQLKYAEQMLARGTLIPDHSIYSWTPASNDEIYCAWIGEFVLYGLYQLGGLPLLFAFRYLCIAAGAVLLLRYAAARGVLARMPTYSIVLLSLLGSGAGTIIKPEILSLVAFHGVVSSYCLARTADLNGANSRFYFLAVPVIVLVWVNSHGGFILAAPFFAAVFLSELLMRWRAPTHALSRRGFHFMLLAWCLSALAICVTPYGLLYPVQLIANFALHTGPRVGESWNVAYQSILGASGFSEIAAYASLFAAAAIALAMLTRRRIAAANWVLLLALLAYVPLFLIYVRATFYLAVIFGYAALDVFATATNANATVGAAARSAMPTATRWSGQNLVNAIAILILIATGSTALYSARNSDKGSWIGFGIAYVNPVVEAEFLANSKLGPRLYNIFDSGGYLLWRLDPAYKVMIDPRFFPYKAWFEDLYRFSTGQTFAEFLTKYPADTAIVDLDRMPVWKNFLQSPDWKLVFYGPTAAIFVRSSISIDRIPKWFATDRFDRIRNAVNALNVFDFATVIEDYGTAWKVQVQIETRLQHQTDGESVQRTRALRDGYRLLASGDYERALEMFRTAAKRPVQGWREPVIVKLLEDRGVAMAGGNAALVASIEAALRELVVR